MIPTQLILAALSSGTTSGLLTLAMVLVLFALSRTPTEPAEAASSDNECLACGAAFPETRESCPQCGWSFQGRDRSTTESFKIPTLNRALPNCRVRPYRVEDFEACAELYLLNEPGRFPPGYCDDFCECLKTGSSLFLVCEVDGRILGVGGISMNRGEHDCASLCYGLIHPAHHKEGFGTVMLLARLALLPEPDGRWFAFMLTVKGSASFYRRFGFSGEMMVDDRNNEMWQYSTLIEAGCLQQCREALAAASITIDTKGIMIPPVAVRAPGPAAEAAPPA